MPYEGPGARQSVRATKITKHGAPAVEGKHPGIAAKSSQADNAYPTAANALAAQNIAIGEEFVIMLSGIHEVASSALAGAAFGDAVYIVEADNTLTKTAGSNVKFGRVSEVDATAGRILINLNLRDTI